MTWSKCWRISPWGKKKKKKWNKTTFPVFTPLARDASKINNSWFKNTHPCAHSWEALTACLLRQIRVFSVDRWGLQRAHVSTEKPVFKRRFCSQNTSIWPRTIRSCRHPSPPAVSDDRVPCAWPLRGLRAELPASANSAATSAPAVLMTTHWNRLPSVTDPAKAQLKYSLI